MSNAKVHIVDGRVYALQDIRAGQIVLKHRPQKVESVDSKEPLMQQHAIQRALKDKSIFIVRRNSNTYFVTHGVLFKSIRHHCICNVVNADPDAPVDAPLKMIAFVGIAEGDEITTCKFKPAFGATHAERRAELMRWGEECDCPACVDPTTRDAYDRIVWAHRSAEGNPGARPCMWWRTTKKIPQPIGTSIIGHMRSAMMLEECLTMLHDVGAPADTMVARAAHGAQLATTLGSDLFETKRFLATAEDACRATGGGKGHEAYVRLAKVTSAPDFARTIDSFVRAHGLPGLLPDPSELPRVPTDLHPSNLAATIEGVRERAPPDVRLDGWGADVPDVFLDLCVAVVASTPVPDGLVDKRLVLPLCNDDDDEHRALFLRYYASGQTVNAAAAEFPHPAFGRALQAYLAANTDAVWDRDVPGYSEFRQLCAAYLSEVAKLGAESLISAAAGAVWMNEGSLFNGMGSATEEVQMGAKLPLCFGFADVLLGFQHFPRAFGAPDGVEQRACFVDAVLGGVAKLYGARLALVSVHKNPEGTRTPISLQAMDLRTCCDPDQTVRSRFLVWCAAVHVGCIVGTRRRASREP